MYIVAGSENYPRSQCEWFIISAPHDFTKKRTTTNMNPIGPPLPVPDLEYIPRAATPLMLQTSSCLWLAQQQGAEFLPQSAAGLQNHREAGLCSNYHHTALVSISGFLLATHGRSCISTWGREHKNRAGTLCCSRGMHSKLISETRCLPATALRLPLSF